MTKFGRLLFKLRAIRLYRGNVQYAKDYHDFIWNWWNPIAWVIAPLTFVLMGLIIGFPEAWRTKTEGGFGMNPYFTNNNIELEWAKWSDPV